jgi:hypothetical protein
MRCYCDLEFADCIFTLPWVLFSALPMIDVCVFVAYFTSVSAQARLFVRASYVFWLFGSFVYDTYQISSQTNMGADTEAHDVFILFMYQCKNEWFCFAE